MMSDERPPCDKCKHYRPPRLGVKGECSRREWWERTFSWCTVPCANFKEVE